MDTSQVYNFFDMDTADMPDADLPWIFVPSDDALPDLSFATENEAYAAQQGYRIAKGFDPVTALPR